MKNNRCNWLGSVSVSFYTFFTQSLTLYQFKKSILINHLRFTPKKCVKVAQKVENVKKNPRIQSKVRLGKSM